MHNFQLCCWKIPCSFVSDSQIKPYDFVSSGQLFVTALNLIRFICIYTYFKTLKSRQGWIQKNLKEVITNGQE